MPLEQTDEVLLNDSFDATESVGYIPHTRVVRKCGVRRMFENTPGSSYGLINPGANHPKIAVALIP